MVTVCHPYDAMELAFIVSILEREKIPYFIVGEHFGSIVPGVQIPAYNERTIQVPEEYAERAIAAIEEFRNIDVRRDQSFTLTSKLRMLAEAILFGWIFPHGSKKPSTNSSKPGTSKREESDPNK